MSKLDELKQKATKRVRSHGAFGEHESYDELDEDAFYKLIVQECIAEIAECETWNEQHELKLHTKNCVLLRMGLSEYCEVKE